MATATDEPPKLDSPQPDPALAALVARAERILSEGPQPGDFLEVSPELRAAIESELEFAQSLRPAGILAESEKKRVFQDRTLMCYYGGQIVAAMRFDEGVVVLAAGEREFEAVFSAIRSSRCRGVVTEYPPRFKGTFVHGALHATV